MTVNVFLHLMLKKHQKKLDDFDRLVTGKNDKYYVKDVLENLGIQEDEIGAILVNDVLVGMDYPVMEDDAVSMYPPMLIGG